MLIISEFICISFDEFLRPGQEALHNPKPCAQFHLAILFETAANVLMTRGVVTFAADVALQTWRQWQLPFLAP